MNVSRAPWVIVCGGFHQLGGMDRANHALANTLIESGHAVHLVGHQVEPVLAGHPLVKTTLVDRPLNSILLGERALSTAGKRVARDVSRRFPGARVLVNGGNCDWPDINWVHSVHAAWPRFDNGSPLWFRAKSALNKWKARRDEKRALASAKVIIANSERTRRDLISIGIPQDRVHTIYLGSDPSWLPATEDQRRSARAQFQLPLDTKVISFVGALGYDRNKGFDTLFSAWRQSVAAETYLLVAGGGRGWHHWKDEVRRSSVSDRVRMIGFTDRIADVYSASDLLVSPVHYEAFGLNVLEAICRGVPAMVSASAGVAELYPPELKHCLLSDPEDSRRLAEMLAQWHTAGEAMRREFGPLSHKMRSRTWKEMAQELIRLASSSTTPAPVEPPKREASASE